MPTPISDSLASVLRSDSTAALAALIVIANAHKDLFAWAARMIRAEPVEPKPNGIGPSRERKSTFGQAKQPRNTVFQVKKARKPPGRGAYHQRRRAARDADDQALLQIVRDSPGASISDWMSAIGKSRSSTVSALKRLRDAGLAESAEGNWQLTEPEARRQPPAEKWVAPLSGAHQAHAHA